MPPLTLLRPVAIILAAFIAGWLVNGWRLGAEIADITASYATATTLASEQAREREQVLAVAIAQIDADHTAERTKSDAENARLRAAVADGTQRLFVRASCPAPRLPQAAADSGVDHGTRAELSPDARPDYHALREGLMRLERKLSACQGVLDRMGEPAK